MTVRKQLTGFLRTRSARTRPPAGSNLLECLLLRYVIVWQPLTVRSWKIVVPVLLIVLGAARAEAAYAPLRVDPLDVARRQSGGEQIVIVDIRAPQAYAQEHIFGARNVPNASLARTARALPKNRTLLLYCTCPAEHGSVKAATTLHDRYGFRKLLVLRGGLDSWRDAGFKVVEPAIKPTPRPLAPPHPWPSPTAGVGVPTATPSHMRVAFPSPIPSSLRST